MVEVLMTYGVVASIFVLILIEKNRRLRKELSYLEDMSSLNLKIGRPVYEVDGSNIHTNNLLSYEVGTFSIGRKMKLGLKIEVGSVRVASDSKFYRMIDIEHIKTTKITQDFKKAQSWVAEFHEEALAKIYDDQTS